MTNNKELPTFDRVEVNLDGGRIARTISSDTISILQHDKHITYITFKEIKQLNKILNAISQ